MLHVRIRYLGAAYAFLMSPPMSPSVSVDCDCDVLVVLCLLVRVLLFVFDVWSLAIGFYFTIADSVFSDCEC